jgi:hypothetical protein
LKEWTTPDSRNTTSTINLEEEEIVDAPGNDGNASMTEQVKRPNPWKKKKKEEEEEKKRKKKKKKKKKMMMMMMMMMTDILPKYGTFLLQHPVYVFKHKSGVERELVV